MAAAVVIALSHLDELFELMLCQVPAGSRAAFVGRRGVEWRATVRISVVGVTSARGGLVIDLRAFPRATVQ